MSYTSKYAQSMMKGGDKPKSKNTAKGGKKVAYHEYDRIAANRAKIKSMRKDDPNNPLY